MDLAKIRTPSMVVEMLKYLSISDFVKVSWIISARASNSSLFKRQGFNVPFLPYLWWIFCMGPPIILDRSYEKSLTTDYEMENYYNWMANHNKTVHDLEVKKMFNAATPLSEP
jgi:hypothetical protein